MVNKIISAIDKDILVRLMSDYFELVHEMISNSDVLSDRKAKQILVHEIRKQSSKQMAFFQSMSNKDRLNFLNTAMLQKRWKQYYDDLPQSEKKIVREILYRHSFEDNRTTAQFFAVIFQKAIEVYMVNAFHDGLNQVLASEKRRHTKHAFIEMEDELAQLADAFSQIVLQATFPSQDLRS